MFTIGDPNCRVVWTAVAWLTLCAGALELSASEPALRVTFVDERTDAELTVEGQVLVEAVDGGILLEDVQRRLWSITPDRLRSRQDAGHDYAPLAADALGAELESELGDQFRTHKTRHYAISTNAGEAYAAWVGSLFERLQRAFLQTWKQAGWELSEPAAPLAAVVFRTQEEYAAYALADAGPEVADKSGYYSMRTNRIVLYDLSTTGRGEGAADASDVERRVAAAAGNVATIVHEATHQIAFNCGMHRRYADTPMWVAEGIAMYCETPDLRTGSGWRTIGRPNLSRLRRYREYAAERREAGSVATLIRDEARFRDPATVLDAYSESWALVDYLLRERRDEFVAYLQQIARKPRLQWDGAEVRLREFEAVFGSAADVEAACVAHVRRMRVR